MTLILVLLLLSIPLVLAINAANQPKTESPEEFKQRNDLARSDFESMFSDSDDVKFIYPGAGAAEASAAFDNQHAILTLRFPYTGEYKSVSYTDIIRVEPIVRTTEYSTTNTAKPTGVSRAVVGSVLAGGAGAVAGAATAKSSGTTTTNSRTLYCGLNIFTRDVQNPLINLNYDNNKFCLDVYSTILAIIN